MEYPVQDESPRILIADDEKVIREILSDFLTMEGFIVRTVDDGHSALAELGRRTYDLVISDLKMPRMGGLDLLEAMNRKNINVLTVIMTGFGTVETAIEAMKRGAYDYILKPFKVEEVVHVVRRGLDRQRLQAENMRLREALSLYEISEAMGRNLAVEPILDLVTTATLDEARADTVTLLLEESPGSGKYVERIRKTRTSDEDLVWELNIDELLRCIEDDTPLLASGVKAQRYFAALPRKVRLVSFCSVPLRLQKRVIGMLNVLSFTRGRSFTEGQRKMLSIIGSRAAMSIENARLYESLLDSKVDLEKANQSLEENFRQTIMGFAQALEENDEYTKGHSERVSFYSRMIAEGMGLEATEVTTVVQAALMHDIGKIGILHDMLNKPDRLTDEERVQFRQHPDKGKRILEPIPFLRKLISGCHCHHEHWDGSGYPQGLEGEEIPLLGRIISVADTYDAMTTNRAYRAALPHDTAMSELTKCAGTQFDPTIVDVFVLEIEKRRADPHAPRWDENLPAGSLPPPF